MEGQVYVLPCINLYTFTDLQISSVFEKSKDFFKLPAEVKKIYTKSDDKQNAYGGYYVSQNQSFRERFDITLNSCNGKLPENHAPGFQLACETFRKECNKTAQLVFKLIAKTFGKEEKFLVNQHRGALFGDMECETKSHLSSIFYQNVEIGENKKESLLMGSHKDFTTITLLMSSAPGLQVRFSLFDHMFNCQKSLLRLENADSG